MALYTIGDTHLSFAAEKPMDIFGGRWVGYVKKLESAFGALCEEDLVVLCGDISWGMSLEEALPDFQFLNDLPGKKIMLKGNHDYWFTTMAKMNAFFSAHGLSKLSVLHNNSYEWEGVSLCGTRGWFYEEETDHKVLKRELGRLETSLQSAKGEQIFCFLHYPPLYDGFYCGEVVSLLRRYAVKRCYYGHLHGESHRLAVEGERDGVLYRLVSADYLDFRPLCLLK